jgi:hypothetical protein
MGPGAMQGKVRFIVRWLTASAGFGGNDPRGPSFIRRPVASTQPQSH